MLPKWPLVCEFYQSGREQSFAEGRPTSSRQKTLWRTWKARRKKTANCHTKRGKTTSSGRFWWKTTLPCAIPCGTPLNSQNYCFTTANVNVYPSITNQSHTQVSGIFRQTRHPVQITLTSSQPDFLVALGAFAMLLTTHLSVSPAELSSDRYFAAHLQYLSNSQVFITITLHRKFTS